jgi:hypothetical protein
MHAHPIRTWQRQHDNGWVTNVAEMPDGTFAAWAAIPDKDAGVDYIEDSLEFAQAAADFSLRLRTPHDECSAACEDWRVTLDSPE